MSGADWSYYALHLVFNLRYQVEVIVIVDHDLGNRSVTNDIEAVLNELGHRLDHSLIHYPIVYFDSQFVCDEIVINDANRFERFAALPRYESMESIFLEAAKRWAKRRRASQAPANDE